MANYTYTRIEKTMNKTDYNTWLTNLTSAPDTKIVFYQEQPTIDEEDKIRVKVLLEVTS